MRRHRAPAHHTAVLSRSCPSRPWRRLGARSLAVIAATVPLALTGMPSPAHAAQDAGQTTAAAQGQSGQEMEQPATAADQPASAEGPKADPCASPEHHQFDFWIGDWEVHNAEGKFQGTNNITTLYGGCILQEHWQGTGGYVGTSFSLYDAPRGVWHQTWVDGEAGLLVIEGGLDGKDMVLRGRRPSDKDPSVEVLHEVRWTPLDDGRVRQHWRASKDGGKTWATLFDGYYSKKSE